MLLPANSTSELIEAAREAERAGQWDEALRQYESALLDAGAIGNEARAVELMRAIGRVHFERGDYGQAVELFTASLTKAEASNLPDHVAAALNCLAAVEQFRGRMDTAEKMYSRAATIVQETGDEHLSALVDQNLGTLANIRGDFVGALRHAQAALARFRTLGDDLCAARVLNNMGMLHVDSGELGHAELCFRSALSLTERLDDAVLRAKIQVNRAELALKRQDFDSARTFIDEAFRAYTRLGSEWGLGETYKFYGMLFRETGNAELAHTHLKLATKLAQTCGDRLLEAEAERERAVLYMNEGRHREALQTLTATHRIFQELQARREIQDVERRLQRVERIYLRIVEMLETEVTMSFAPDAVEQYQRVADYAHRLAKAVGFDERELTWLRIGAFLYDIGKRTVPAEVLNKPGPLDPDEWEVVQQHVLASEDVVAELDPPWDMRPMVRHHHERWDGTGYPDRLKGQDIPLAARILCIADAYTALTSPRAFRAAMEPQGALQVMDAAAGRIFDPDLFRMFRTLVADELPASEPKTSSRTQLAQQAMP